MLTEFIFQNEPSSWLNSPGSTIKHGTEKSEVWILADRDWFIPSGTNSDLCPMMFFWSLICSNRLLRSLSALILKRASIHVVPYNNWVLSPMWSSYEGRRSSLRSGETRLGRNFQRCSMSLRGLNQWWTCPLRLTLGSRQSCLTLRIMLEPIAVEFHPFVAFNCETQWLYLDKVQCFL